MNWHKAKTIMILFLIAVNLSLLTYTVVDGYNQRSAETRVIENAIGILSANDIAVDRKVIDGVDIKKSVKEVYAYNIISDYEGFAKLLIGNEVRLTQKNTYVSPSGKITFQGDRFYTKASDNICLIAFNPTAKDIKSNVKTIFTQLGIAINENDISISENNGLHLAQISKSINKLPIFGSKIKMSFSASGITSVEGAWYEPEIKEGSKINIRSISGCLIDYMNERKSNKPCTITKITLGYATLDENTYHASLVLTPVFAIENNLGETIYIDARENI